MPGHLALQRGPLLEAAVRELEPTPDILLVNATGRDHPRRRSRSKLPVMPGSRFPAQTSRAVASPSAAEACRDRRRRSRAARRGRPDEERCRA